MFLPISEPGRFQGELKHQSPCGSLNGSFRSHSRWPLYSGCNNGRWVGQLTPCEPMAVAVGWLDAYRAASIAQYCWNVQPGRHDRVRLRRPQDHPWSGRHRGLLARSLHRNACARTRRFAGGQRRGVYLVPNPLRGRSSAAVHRRRWNDQSLSLWSYM